MLTPDHVFLATKGRDREKLFAGQTNVSLCELNIRK